MLRPDAKRLLQAPDLIGRFRAIAEESIPPRPDERPLFAGGGEPSQQAGGRPGGDDRVEQVRRRLLREIDVLDERLHRALDRNSHVEWSRYLILALLSLIIVVAVPFGVVRQEYLTSVLGGGASLPPALWALHNLRGLRDCRIRLHMMLLRYRPRVRVCPDLLCLRQVAEEIAVALELLAPESTARLTPQRATGASP